MHNFLSFASDLSLKGNPLNDRRFRKLVESDRCLPRQVLDYIKQHCPKSQESKGGTGKGKKGKGGKAKDDNQVKFYFKSSLLHIIQYLYVTDGKR